MNLKYCLFVVCLLFSFIGVVTKKQYILINTKKLGLKVQITRRSIIAPKKICAFTLVSRMLKKLDLVVSGNQITQ